MKIPFCAGLSNVSKRLGALKVVAGVARIEPVTNQGFESALVDVLAANENGVPAWLAWQHVTAVDEGNMEHDFNRVAREFALLAKSFGLIDSGNSLLEAAIPLRSYLQQGEANLLNAWTSGRINPLEIDKDGGYGERALLWETIFRGDAITWIFTHLLADRETYDPNDDFMGFPDESPETAEHGGEQKKRKLAEVKNNLMTRAYAFVREKFDESLWTDVENIDELRSYCDRMHRWSSFRHHIPPRLEWLVDLGLLAAKPKTEDSETQQNPYAVLNPCKRAGAFLRKELLQDFDGNRFVHQRLFSFLAHIYDLPTRRANDHEAFLYFALGFSRVARDLGDTPARSAAIAGAVGALARGICIDLEQLYAVGRKPPEKFAKMIEYSGGSRLDEEYLFNIRAKALPQLLAELNASAS